MTKSLFGKAALFAALVLVSAPLKAESLADALVSAYKNSNLLEQNRALLRAADEDVAQAFAAMRPVINYVLAAQRDYSSAPFQDGSKLRDTASLSISADMLLWDFGGTRKGIEIAREAVLATREGLQQVEQGVLLTAVQAYMNVIRASEFVALRQSNLELIDQELKSAQDRFSLGELTRTDVALAEARRAVSEANLAAAQGDLLAAREDYKAATGHYPKGLNPAPQTPALPKTLKEALALAQQTHPSLKQAQHQVKLAELAIERSKTAIKPRLTGGLQVGVDGEGTQGAGVNLRLSGPIYQGGQLASQIRKAIANRDAARSSLLQTAVQVDQAVAQAWVRRDVARAQLEAVEGQIRAARVAFRGVRDEAALGARTTLDVLTAEQDLLDAEAARISANADLYISTYALLAEIGLLNAQHLGLSVPIYDVSAYSNAVGNAPVKYVSPEGKKLDAILKGLGKN
ncbi:MAG: TolC family outer membrane protein [Deltaproteobacteria bacterium]